MADYAHQPDGARGVRVLGGDVEPEFLGVPYEADRLRRITPTDVSQFVRLEQCERFLRLRLHERAVSRDFLRASGVAPQEIPPLLTLAGRAFEEQVEAALTARYRSLVFGGDGQREPDNAAVVAALRELPAGETLVMLQPRLEAVLGDWRLRGDVDLLRAERAGDGRLALLIADMKSSTAARVEHRLQVAFYDQMLASVLAEAGIAHEPIALGILYRGSAETLADPTLAPQRELARARFNVEFAQLELVEDAASYLASVGDLVTAPGSTAARVAAGDFAAIPFHLSYKCDGCLYNEFCLKWCAERDDLSLLPHLTAQDKGALERAGLVTTRQLATLKECAAGGGCDLAPAPGREDEVRALSVSWPVGPRLDELIWRARRYQHFRNHDLDAPSTIPSKGYGSLPYCDEQQNPNLIRVFIDAQHDFLEDRLYLVGALVVANKDGLPVRRRSVVRLASGMPDCDAAERDLLAPWVRDTLRAVVDLAEPDAEGKPRAPIHLIVFNRYVRDVLLAALARHFETVMGLTPLYDFMTQLAAFDSPVLTFLDEEIRELKNYPMLCQSLQSVATYLKFDWRRPEDFRRLFHERVFDYIGKLGEDGDYYTRRARFNSQVPLEYAYAAWNALPTVAPGGRDDYRAYRQATPALLRAFEARRLEALERITADFTGNKQTEKRAFDLPDISRFTEKARDLAHALEEFVLIERHAKLSDWKSRRLPPPERRVLAGDTLLVRYREADQDLEPRLANRQHWLQQRRREELERGLGVGPDGERLSLTPEQRKSTDWSNEGCLFRLELTAEGCGCDLEEVLGLSTLKPGDRVVIAPRWAVDGRLPAAEQARFTPTPRQLLYQARGELKRIVVRRDEAGKPLGATVEVEMVRSPRSQDGFAFSDRLRQPLTEGALYTIDEDPNDWHGYHCLQVCRELCQRDDNPLYRRLTGATVAAEWPSAAAEGQRRFFAGLTALQRLGAFAPFEESKRDFIAEYGDAPTLLVQGPPGTGKSFGTAFALLARLQGAMAAGRELRVLVSCKTHAATDVLVEKLARARQDLERARLRHPDLFRAYFDERLLDLPVARLEPRAAAPDGVIPLRRRKPKSGDKKMAEVLAQWRWCVAGATPGGIRGLVKERWSKGLLGHELCDLLVLDEASQISLPEAVMAALVLKADGRVIVVGDHRQMPPIVQHDWDREARRTFKEYRTFESLFNALLAQNPPMIKFNESFRLHADMAEFLRREIYAQDGIDYFSRKQERLRPVALEDPFVAAALSPAHPLVVVVHDEASSQIRNPFEQALVVPLLEALADPARCGLEPEHGLGVVVPHRAQRAALQEALPLLSRVDPATGSITLSAVDTVERFQGGERDVIVVSATESDRAYLLVAGDFLLDPRRLTVALSRAKHKLILVAARSVFQLFSADEETFAHAQLWKNLLRTTCTVPLWSGRRQGVRVEVWGNAPTAGDRGPDRLDGGQPEARPPRP